MKQRLTIAMVCALSLTCLLSGCSDKKKYADAEKALNECVDIMEQYIGSIDKAGSAEDVVKAMDGFSTSIEKLKPTMQKLMEKYPELKDSQNVPEELKGIQARLEESSKKMAGATMKIMPYMSDPEVQKAQEKMQSVMASME